MIKLNNKIIKVVVVGVILSVCNINARAIETSHENLVARKDFKVNQEWQSPKVMGKGFWNMFLIDGYLVFNPWPNQLFRDTYMYKNSGKIYSSINIFNQASNTVTTSEIFKSSWPNYIKHHGLYFKDAFVADYNPKIPFFFSSDSFLRPPFGNPLGEHKYDFVGYEQFKEKYPNFMGFIQPEWCNECILRGPWRAGGMAKRYEKKLSKEVIARAKKTFPIPSTRKESLALVKKLCRLLDKFYFNDPEKLSYLRSCMNVDHYTNQWGKGDVAWVETSNSSSYPYSYRWQAMSLFARGASHQYSKKWGWYLAAFYNGYSADGKCKVGDCHVSYIKTRRVSSSYSWLGPNCGMSLSLYRRVMYLAYLVGTSYVCHEAPTDKFINRDSTLSPWGKSLQKWFDFTQKNKRGISYSPVALLMPFNQCYPVYGGKSWMRYKYKRPDWMIDSFMFTITPHTRLAKNGKEGCLANSPYGDIYDAILPDTPKKPVALSVLNKYKVAIMLGDYGENQALANRLMEYVKTGGTLLMNIKQLNNFFPKSFTGIKRSNKNFGVVAPVTSVEDSKKIVLRDKYEFEKVRLNGAKAVLLDSIKNVLACVNNYGKGKVIITTLDNLVPVDNMEEQAYWTYLPYYVLNRKFPFQEYFLNNIVKEVLPLEIKGDIEYGLNKVDDGWLLYLINNKGITKFVDTKAVVDSSKTATVKVYLKDLKVSKLTELLSGKTVKHNKTTNSFDVNVPPGDIKIIKIK